MVLGEASSADGEHSADTGMRSTPAVAAHEEALDPFVRRARASACGVIAGLRSLSTENHLDRALSTERRQAAILVDVHSALPRISWRLANIIFLGRSRMDNLLETYS